MIKVKRRTPMNLVLVSLDDFKEVNDRFGESVGDVVLKEVAQFLRTVVPIRCLYRYSGDEFALVLDEKDGAAGGSCARAVEVVEARFRMPWGRLDTPIQLSASIAVVDYPDPAGTLEEVVSQLEYCVGLSKKDGKGRTILSTPDTIEKVRRRSRILAALKRAVADDGFEEILG